MPRNALTQTQTTAVETEELPRWDLSALFPGLDSPEFAEGLDLLVSGIDDLVNLFAELQVFLGVGEAFRNRACGRFRAGT